MIVDVALVHREFHEAIEFLQEFLVLVHTLDWGPDQGLPALVLDENAPKVSGLVFSTDKLAEHWPMLDEFEGFQYQRVKVMVEFETGEMIESWTYQMNPHAKLMQLESERT